MKATGVLVMRKPQRKSRPRRLKVRNASADLPAAERHKLKLKIRRKTRRAGSAALKHGAKLRAKLTITATDAAGNRTVRHRTVRLRLPKHRSR